MDGTGEINVSGFLTFFVTFFLPYFLVLLLSSMTEWSTQMQQIRSIVVAICVLLVVTALVSEHRIIAYTPAYICAFLFLFSRNAYMCCIASIIMSLDILQGM